MEKITEKAKFSLKLLVDEKRNKVVLAEACRDFVDVLCSLLTLPMGTIVRLLEKHQKSQAVTVGCFNNLYQSVSDMLVDDFETEACKSMLLYPRSSEEIHCRRLKLNIDDTEATKFFTCLNKESCRVYSNFNTAMCSCGELMTKQVLVPEEEQIGGPVRNGEDGVFVTCRSSYIVTDDLKVRLSSLGVIADVLCGLGYESCDSLKEILLDVGFEEVLTLLGNLLVSEFPLTSTFLKRPYMPRGKKRLSSTLHDVKLEPAVKGGLKCNVTLYVRKLDRKILYAECNEDFFDSLLTFLVLPLEMAWSLSNDGTTSLGCVGNLCLSKCRGATVASSPWKVPYYYSCTKQILDVQHMPLVVYECFFRSSVLNFARQVPQVPRNEVAINRSIKVTPRDPKIRIGNSSECGSGFVKRDAKFIVSDDLVITPMRSSSTIALFKKSNINILDLEVKELTISKAELISILRASLISPSALTNGLSKLLAKKLKN